LVDQIGGKAALIAGSRIGLPIAATMRALGGACTAVVVVQHAGAQGIATDLTCQVHELGLPSTPVLTVEPPRSAQGTVLSTILSFLQRVHGLPQAVGGPDQGAKLAGRRQ
jgi:hypothetical protein